MRRRLISLAELVLPFVVAAVAWQAFSLLGPFPQKLFPARCSSALPSLKAQIKIALPKPGDTLSVEFLEYQKVFLSEFRIKDIGETVTHAKVQRAPRFARK